jgi:DNA-binding CsgD family transcriptional regulator
VRVLTLSEREEAVLKLIAWGYTNQQIAAHQNVSVKTIEGQRYNGLRKLRLRDRAELVRYAVSRGWLTMDQAPDVTPLRQSTQPRQTRLNEHSDPTHRPGNSDTSLADRGSLRSQRPAPN